jgi:hypothetical protein
LDPTTGGTTEPRRRFETEHVIATQWVTGAAGSDFDAIIERARVGELMATDGVLSLAIDQNARLSTNFSPIYHPLISEGPRLPSLLIRGAQRHGLFMEVGNPVELDWELKAADLPFDTLDELLLQYNLPLLGQMGDSTTLEVVARTPAVIGANSAIHSGKAMIKCPIARGLVPEKLRIGYRIFRNEQQIDRGSVDGTAFEWRDENEFRIGSCLVEIGDALFVQAFLSYDGVALHQLLLSDPEKHLNPRHAIHQVFDQDVELLRKMLLKPDPDTPYAFENAVSMLLNIVGFSVTNYGRIPKVQRGPDIVAISGSGQLAVIECTVGLLDEKDKLAKLVQRTKLIREKLTTSGYGHLHVQSAIVTPLSRDEVAANLETAGTHGIAVVCKEDLEALLNQVGFPPNADRILENAKTLIPPSRQVL